MALKTRGSAALEKAQRRLANLNSIDENLDLGYGLTLQAYRQMLDDTRAALGAHNVLVSNLNESGLTVTEMEKALSEMSERMLTGVATKYGRKSKEYSKAGGSIRKGKTAARSTSSTVKATESANVASVNGIDASATNGIANGTAPLLMN